MSKAETRDVFGILVMRRLMRQNKKKGLVRYLGLSGNKING